MPTTSSLSALPSSVEPSMRGSVVVGTQSAECVAHPNWLVGDCKMMFDSSPSNERVFGLLPLDEVRAIVPVDQELVSTALVKIGCQLQNAELTAIGSRVGHTVGPGLQSAGSLPSP